MNYKRKKRKGGSTTLADKIDKGKNEILEGVDDIQQKYQKLASWTAETLTMANKEFDNKKNKSVGEKVASQTQQVVGSVGGKKIKYKRTKRMRKTKRSRGRRKTRRRRRGGSSHQLKPHPITPSVRMNCRGMFNSKCKKARKLSEKQKNNSAYCAHVMPKFDTFIAKNQGKCKADMKTKNKLKWQNEWQDVANAKCISDEAVCPTNYPGKGYRAPKMVANIAEAEEKMGGKFGIFTGIVKDFGGDKNRAFAWLQDKQMKEMAAYKRATGATGGRKRRRKSRKKKRKSRRRKSRRRRRRSRRRR